MGGNLGFAAMQSLKAIDDWIATLNANMAGSARTGFKASRVTFKGGAASVIRNPSNSGILPIQFAEPNLSSAGTTIDFSQGAIVASTEKTHLAIQGNGFFMLQADTTGTGPIYYTRDGEFHLDANNRMRSPQGLFLVRSSGNPISVSDIDTFDPNTGTGITGGAIPVQLINNLQGLKYSKYGATVFEIGTAVTAGTTTNNIVMQSLEASNASLTSLVPELSLAQKMFSAISKVLQVFYQNMDTILNLIR